LIAAGAVSRHVDRDPVSLEAVEEVGNCDSGRIDGPATLDLRY
jgi:hypothetical protein